MPAPRITWQDLQQAPEDGKRREAIGGELYVTPATGEGVQPDILFVSEERKSIGAEDWLRGAPDLVVEILSPTTEDRDRGIKRELYQRQGVRQYWVVDPRHDAVEVWRFQEEPSHERFTGTLPVRLGSETVGEIDLDAVFARSG